MAAQYPHFPERVKAGALRRILAFEFDAQGP
jgi:hypothetical protein